MLTLLSNYRLESTALNQDEFSLLTRFCDLYANTLVPYLARCLMALFPATSINPLLGQKSDNQEVTGTNGVGRIDIDEIYNVLKPFLPQRPVAPSHQKISLEDISSKPADDAELDTVKESELPEVDVGDNEVANDKEENAPSDEDPK